MPMQYPHNEGDWLALRHQYVSSTESACLFGLSPYHTAFELAVVKKEEKPASWEQNERMVWGLRLQEAIAKGISEDYGVKVRRVTGYAVHADIRMGASFDYEIVGITKDAQDNELAVKDPCLQQMYRDLGPGVLEIKNVDAYIFRKEWKTDEESQEVEAPPHFEIQVQHQLAAIGTRKWAAIGVFIGGNRTMVVLREKDDEFATQLLIKVDHFWKKLAAGEMPPIVLPQDVDIIRKIYLGSSPGKVFNGQDSEELRNLCVAYQDAATNTKFHEEARKSIGAKILMIIGDAEVGLATGFRISATTVSETQIPAYTRKAFRMCKVTELKPGEPKKGKRSGS